MCRGEETGPSGKRAFLNIIAYDEKTKAYMEHSISSFGETEDDSGGSFVGDRLVFVMGGGGKGPKFDTRRPMYRRSSTAIGLKPPSTADLGG